MKKTIATSPDLPTKHETLSGGEIAARDIEEQDWLNGQELRQWEDLMENTDIDMSRGLEDIIDALDSTTRGGIAIETLDKYNNKKTIRGQKPA